MGYSHESTITSSYATGSVDGTSDYVGGLVGSNSSSSSIKDSYATGSVTGKSSIGGFLGYYNSGSLTHNYWDTQSSGKTKGIGNGKQSGVKGKTSAQMTKQATFKGWESSQWHVFVSIMGKREMGRHPYNDVN